MRAVIGPSQTPLSLAFSARELNGEVLLAEVALLRRQGVAPASLQKLSNLLSRSRKKPQGLDAQALRDIAERQTENAALSSLLHRYADKVRHPADAAALVDHFHRLAQAAALLAVLRSENVGELGGEEP
jgi:hypothetical protein